MLWGDSSATGSGFGFRKIFWLWCTTHDTWLPLVCLLKIWQYFSEERKHCGRLKENMPPQMPKCQKWSVTDVFLSWCWAYSDSCGWLWSELPKGGDSAPGKHLINITASPKHWNNDTASPHTWGGGPGTSEEPLHHFLAYSLPEAPSCGPAARNPLPCCLVVINSSDIGLACTDEAPHAPVAGRHPESWKPESFALCWLRAASNSIPHA